MPTEHDCAQIEIRQVTLEARINAISERLDEVLKLMRAAGRWAIGAVSLLVVVEIFGKEAVLKIIMALITK